MRRKCLFLFLLLVFAARSSWGAPLETAVATMTSVHGTVEMKAPGSRAWRVVKGTEPLFEGTAIRVGKGGGALLLQPGSPPRALREGEELVVSAGKRWLNGISPKPVTLAQHRSMLQLLTSAARSSRSRPTLVRPVRPETAIALSPRAENVLDDHPTFVWRDYGPGSQYELELYRNDQSIWSIRTTEARAVYPRDRPPLSAGSYRWQVYVKPPAGEQAADGAPFAVLAAGAAQKIRADIAAAQALVPDASAVNLPLITVYITHQLYTPAAAELQRALALTPEDAALRGLLAHLNSLAGRAPVRGLILEK
jgi:hypothetical protein